MSFKMFSSVKRVPSNSKPEEKSKDPPSVAQPATKPGNAPVEVAPARKS